MEKTKHLAKDHPKDRIEIEVGDFKQPEWLPQVKAMRWDNEVNLSLRHLPVGNERHNFYEIEPDENHPEGGYEFEVIFDEKPNTNKVRFSVNHKELDFFYQPELTQKEIDEGVIRPDNVVGSYAVYHKTKGGMNRADGMEYKSGKAFHIYRPKVIDANGDWVWGDLNITGANATITIDQDFLDNALYPVIVDPTFGYTTSGGSLQLIENNIRGSKFTISEAGTGDSISWNVTDGLSASTSKANIYNNDAGITQFTNGQTSEQSSAGSNSNIWYTQNFVSSPTFVASTDYWLVAWSPSTAGSYQLRYDTGGTDQGLNDSASYGTWPDPLVETLNTNKHSIYTTYTATATDPEPNVSDTITLTEDSTILINTLYLSVSEDITITESPTVQSTLYIDTSDSLTISESSTVYSNSFIDSSDTITLTENTSLSLNSFVDINDSVTITEDVTVSAFVVQDINVDINDSATITESSSVEMQSDTLIVTDFSSNGNNLTNSNVLASTLVPVVGWNTSAFFNPSVSALLQISDASQNGALDLTGDFTFETWANFKATPSSGSRYSLIHKNGGGSTAGYYWAVWNDGGTLKFEIFISEDTGGTTADRVTWLFEKSSVALSTDTWYHLAVTCDVSQAAATEFELFIDGSSEGNGTVALNGGVTSINNSTDNFNVGNNSTTANDLSGYLSDLRVWNDIRTSTEISNNYQSRLTGGEANLAGYYPFENITSGLKINIAGYTGVRVF